MSDPAAVIAKVLDAGPVIPVVIIDDISHAVPLARSLLAGGVTMIEVTLRTAAAPEAIRAIAAEVEGITVGAGTVVEPRQLDTAHGAGACFAVSPGATARLLDAADTHSLPLLPGASTVSESLALLERGYPAQKFFPAAAAGGPAYLKSLISPLPQLRFCPTGGITEATARDYLSLANVACVGGSWLVPADAVAAGDWKRIEVLARAAGNLVVPAKA